jgi:hypothetical protein
MKRWVVAASVAAALTAMTVPATAQAGAAPFCGIRWGSLPKTAPAMVAEPVVNVRAGQHACFDRFVVDLAGPASGYDVSYVAQATLDPSGFPVHLRGGAFLQIGIRAPTWASLSKPWLTRVPLVNVRGFRTFREAAFTGAFEGQTSFGLGVRARLPFRVFVLPGPGHGSRVVIDVAHRWST